MAQAMAQGILRRRMLLDKVPGKPGREIRSPACWLLLSLFGAVACIMGNFLLIGTLGKHICVPEETLKTESLMGKSQKEESSWCPKDCGTKEVDLEECLAQLWIQDVTHISVALHRENKNSQR